MYSLLYKILTSFLKKGEGGLVGDLMCKNKNYFKNFIVLKKTFPVVSTFKKN